MAPLKNLFFTFFFCVFYANGQDNYISTLSKNNNGFILSQVICKDAAAGGTEFLSGEQEVVEPEIYLRVSVNAPSAVCTFSFSTDGIQFKNIGTSFNAAQGKWIGAKPGLFCIGAAGTETGGYADFDWFV